MCSETLAIRATGLGKRYRLGTSMPRYVSLRDSLARWTRTSFLGAKRERTDEFWALRGVDLAVAPGEVVGLVGSNGAGKSTLLRLLARITAPTEGRAEIHGRVGSLLEVGSGFHLELTGRENIFLSGAILGMRTAEIRAKLDEIIAFAEVDRFLDTPVKHYSSGMHLRLAFAVAAHLESEILLVDEVLAVGDAAFQRKCLRRIHDVAHAGRTIVFVSHNLNAVRTLCSRAVWLDRGSIRAEGSATSIVASYLASGSDTTLTRRWEATNELPPSSAQLLCARILAEKSPEATLSIRNPVGIELEFEHSFTVGELHVDMQLFDLNGLCVLRSFAPPKTFHPGVVRARCHIPADLLNAGGYRIGGRPSSPAGCLPVVVLRRRHVPQ